MKYLILLFMTLFITGSGHTQVAMPELLIIYQARDGAVMVYIEQTDEHRTLISADDVPVYARVQATFHDAGIVSVQVMGLHEPYSSNGPEEYLGKTIGALGLQNTLYLIESGDWQILLERPLLPDDYMIPSTINFADPILRANFGVEMSGSKVIWVEAADDFSNEDFINGYGRLVVYDIFDETITLLDPLPGTPHDMLWSNDGRYGLFQAVSVFEYGRYSPYLLDLESLTIEQLPLHEQTSQLPTNWSPMIWPYGWLNSGEFIYSLTGSNTVEFGLFAYNPQTATTHMLMPTTQANILGESSAIHPESGQILIVLLDGYPDAGPLNPGRYHYRSLGIAEPELISVDLDLLVYNTAFISADTLYFYYRSRSDHRAFTLTISTGELLSQESLLGELDRVYPSPHGVIFTTMCALDGSLELVLERCGYLMYEPVEGGAQHYIPNLMVENIQWLDSEYFLSFAPDQMYWWTHPDLRSHVVVAERTSGASKTVQLGEGNRVIAATWDLQTR